MAEIRAREARRYQLAARRWGYQWRFLAIWGVFALLLLFSALAATDSLRWTSIQAILPFAAFLTIAAMGQAVVIMTGGIDLSVPAVVTMVGIIILNVTGGENGALPEAILIAVAMSLAVGLANGILVALFRLNPIVVTLAVGSIVTGGTLWYRQGLRQEASVPPSLAAFGSSDVGDVNLAVFVALGLVLLATLILHYTSIGRRFTAVGANPGAAWMAGIPVQRYQIGAYTAAAFLYGACGILLAAFIRNPTLRLGEPYLLAPIAAVVLGGASLSGGVGSMVATMGGALFFTQLDQALRVMGQPTAVQYIIQGIAIATGMAFSVLHFRRIIGQVAARTRAHKQAGGAAAGGD